MPIAWNSRLTLDVPVLDRQHRELIDRASKVIDAMRERRGAQEVRDLTAFLLGYIDTHFTAEEGLMRAEEYPGLGVHAAQHAELSRRARALHARLRAEGPSLSVLVETNDLICGWFFDHIAGADAEVAAWLGRERSTSAA